jgi:fermentation-respiration switch protein FrsA (DUF1100 family)
MTKQHRRLNWLKRVFWILTILIGVFLLVVVPYALSWLLINHSYHFPDPDSGKTPATFGLGYESVTFSSEPGIQLRGWFLPAQENATSFGGDSTKEAKGTMVLIHGLNRTRVEMLTRAVFLAQNGYNALLFDLRHHGESEGKVSSLGFYERRDVRAALDYLKTQRHLQNHLGLWGVSMGATASLLAFAESPEVSCSIADSPFLSFEDTIVHHAHLLLGLPRFPIVDLVLLMTSHRLGFRKEDFDLRKTVRELGPRPILLVAGTADQRMPPEIVKTLYAIATSPQKRLLLIDGAKHGAAYRIATNKYQQAVLEFLDRTLNQ